MRGNAGGAQKRGRRAQEQVACGKAGGTQKRRQRAETRAARGRTSGARNFRRHVEVAAARTSAGAAQKCTRRLETQAGYGNTCSCSAFKMGDARGQINTSSCCCCCRWGSGWFRLRGARWQGKNAAGALPLNARGQINIVDGKVVMGQLSAAMLRRNACSACGLSRNVDGGMTLSLIMRLDITIDNAAAVLGQGTGAATDRSCPASQGMQCWLEA